MDRLSRNKALQHVNSAQQRICYKCMQKYIIKRAIFTTHRQNMSCRITNTWRNTQTHCEVSREETTDRRHKQLRAISGRVGRETRLTKHTRGDQHLLSETWSRITNTRNSTQSRARNVCLTKRTRVDQHWKHIYNLLRVTINNRNTDDGEPLVKQETQNKIKTQKNVMWVTDMSSRKHV